MNIQLPHFQRLLNFSNLKPKKKVHINPRFRAYGRARIDMIEHIHNQQDWERLWKTPSNAFPFAWTQEWKHCIEYRVEDYVAEVGFFIDFIGLRVDEFGPRYARFSSPEGDFYIGVSACSEGQHGTPTDGFRLQFMVLDLFPLVDELQKRGVAFEQPPRPHLRDKSLACAVFRTPHGIAIDLLVENKLPEIEIPELSLGNRELPQSSTQQPLSAEGEEE